MKKWRIFIGAFAASMIVIAGLCGFAAVDLSTERFMPGQFGVFLRIEPVPGEELAIVLLGRRYSVKAEDLEAPRKALEDYRGLLPAAPRIARALTGQAVRALAGKLDMGADRP
jgi:hypothetical protein